MVATPVATQALSPVPLRRSSRAAGSTLRWLLLAPLAVLIVLVLVLLMHWMIRTPEGNSIEHPAEDTAQIVRVEAPKPKPQDPDQAAPSLPQLSPPPPPGAPPSLARPSLPTIAVPSIPISVPQVNLANVSTGIAATAATAAGTGSGAGLGTGNGSGSGLGSGFGGFAGSGAGGLGGGAKFGSAEGFKGRELVPLSTARPQMPAWACKQKIKGWVEVLFTVNTRGHVENVKIIDAQPRGVYEGAAIESVGNWIYAPGKQPAEVKQRVEMDPDDCAFNYDQ